MAFPLAPASGRPISRKGERLSLRRFRSLDRFAGKGLTGPQGRPIRPSHRAVLAFARLVLCGVLFDMVNRKGCAGGGVPQTHLIAGALTTRAKFFFSTVIFLCFVIGLKYSDA